jgi:hypothetical protein
VAVIVAVVAAVLFVAAMFAATIVAVDPMMSVLRPMAGLPNHFEVVIPVTRAMTVEWPVTQFDAEFRPLQSGPESNARDGNRHEEQYFLDHTFDSFREGRKDGSIDSDFSVGKSDGGQKKKILLRRLRRAGSLMPNPFDSAQGRLLNAQYRTGEKTEGRPN